jgi:hypothetical protein
MLLTLMHNCMIWYYHGKGLPGLLSLGSFIKAVIEHLAETKPPREFAQLAALPPKSQLFLVVHALERVPGTSRPCCSQCHTQATKVCAECPDHPPLCEYPCAILHSNPHLTVLENLLVPKLQKIKDWQ